MENTLSFRTEPLTGRAGLGQFIRFTPRRDDLIVAIGPRGCVADAMFSLSAEQKRELLQWLMSDVMRTEKPQVLQPLAESDPLHELTAAVKAQTEATERLGSICLDLQGLAMRHMGIGS